MTASSQTDLADRFEMVLEAVEEDEGWATNRVTPGKVILGNLDGIEAGVRQMIRKVPLIVRRNQTRDYLDVAALATALGTTKAGDVLSRIGEYYDDQGSTEDGVASQLARQLGEPRPADGQVIGQLSAYRRLRQEWKDWDAVTDILQEVAARMAAG